MTDSNFPEDNETWEPDPEVVTQRVEGETVLVHLRTNEIYALNTTGSRAWDLLATGIVGRRCRRNFSANSTPLRIRSDDELDTLLANLIEKKLLRPSAA